MRFSEFVAGLTKEGRKRGIILNLSTERQYKQENDVCIADGRPYAKFDDVTTIGQKKNKDKYGC